VERTRLLQLYRRAVEANPDAGRQAAMKAATTLLDGLACMIRHHGVPPAPGHPSGDLEAWS
jgi:hypothetical protein